MKYWVSIHYEYNFITGLHEPIATDHYFKELENGYDFIHVFSKNLINFVTMDDLRKDSMILKEITETEYEQVMGETLKTFGYNKMKHKFI